MMERKQDVSTTQLSPSKNIYIYIYVCVYIYMKSESEVTQSCPTLGDPMDYSPSGSSVHGIFQARVLEWGAIAFSTLSTTW